MAKMGRHQKKKLIELRRDMNEKDKIIPVMKNKLKDDQGRINPNENLVRTKAKTKKQVGE